MNHELLRLAKLTGSDAEFRTWVQRQRSCLSGTFSEYLETGEGRSIAAHWRAVSRGAGTGYKPPYSAIPLTFIEHARAHQKGDSALMPREMWEYHAEQCLREWVESKTACAKV